MIAHETLRSSSSWLSCVPFDTVSLSTYINMLNAIVLLQIFLVSLTNGQTSPPSTLYTFPAPTTTAPPPIETTPTIAPSPTATPVTTVSPPIATTAPVHEVCFKCWNATCHNKDHQNSKIILSNN